MGERVKHGARVREPVFAGRRGAGEAGRGAARICAAGREAALSAEALSRGLDPAKLGVSLGSEWGTLWVMLAVSAVNVALGVWRPRFRRR